MRIPKPDNAQCTDCSVDLPYEEVIQAGGVFCGGCGRTHPNTRYVLAEGYGQDEFQHMYQAIKNHQPASINGWEMAIDDNAGVVEWTKGALLVYATPFYDDTAGVPISICTADGDTLEDGEMESMDLLYDATRDFITYLCIMAPILMEVETKFETGLTA